MPTHIHTQPLILSVLISKLKAFAVNPAPYWGCNSIGATTIRVVTPADVNSARIQSGDYTDYENDSFTQQLMRIERIGGTAYFPGKPNSMPNNVGMLGICDTCKLHFRTNSKTARTCYDCVLERICPTPAPHSGPFRENWKRDGWACMVNGIYGYRNEVDFWWEQNPYTASSGYQGLRVLGPLGAPTRMVFSTVLRDDIYRTYDVTYNFGTEQVGLSVADRCSSVNLDELRGTFVGTDAFPEEVILRILAMLPPFMDPASVAAA